MKNRDRTLQIIGFVTPFTSVDEFSSVFLKNGFTVSQVNGSLVSFVRENDPEFGISCILEEDGILFLITNAKKSDQIPDIIYPIFERESEVYNLSIGPSMMMDIIDDYIGEGRKGKVSYFSGRYIPGVGRKARIRPDVGRNVQYHGDDGYHTLKEWSNYYGIYPNIISINLFSGLQFRLDRKGIISIHKGISKEIMPILKEIIERNTYVSNRIKETSDYIEVSLSVKGDDRNVGVEIPWKVQFDNIMNVSIYSKIMGDVGKEWGVSYIPRIINDDGKFLLGDLLDESKGIRSEIRIKDDNIMIYPVTRSDLGSNLRFYDMITNNLDIHAEVI